jgi:HAD superfamily hydrolase (TIGR01509 family)
MIILTEEVHLLKIKAILFDMDGVLIEAKDWHYESLNQALGLFGVPISRYDDLMTFDGLPTRKKLEMLSVERGLPVELHSFLNILKQRYTQEIVQRKCRPLFVHEKALSQLKFLNYKMAVCSNSVRGSVELMMEKSSLRPYLDLMISNEDVSKGKPSPEMYLKAMDELNVLPSECLILEDNPNGIAAAKASGGNLMIINKVHDVNIEAILKRVSEVEQEGLK